jgi:phenylpropionate dioxygenase-like ring-hydroxylating dioxygenase large terminal subunit
MSTRDLRELVELTRTHQAAYTDPAIFEEEMSKIFAATWVYLAHESQLPAPDSFLTCSMGSRPIVLSRSADGAIHAVLNRCRHRGVAVVTASEGVAPRFRCAYHGWTYRNSGELIGVTHPKAYTVDFDRTLYGLSKVRVESVEGFIFGTLQPDLIPLVEHLGSAVDALREWRMRAPGHEPIVRNGARKIEVRANWKVVWENAADGYHPAFTHRSLLEMTSRHGEGLSLSYFAGDPDDLPIASNYLGHGNVFLDQRPALTGSLWEHARPVPGAERAVAALTERSGAETAAKWLELAPSGSMNISIFPTLFINGNFVTTLEARAPGVVVMNERAVTLDGVPAEVNWLRLRYCEDFVNFGEPDDIEMWERAQRGFAARESPWNEISRGLAEDEDDSDTQRTVTATNEEAIRGFWREWLRLMMSEPKLSPA